MVKIQKSMTSQVGGNSDTNCQINGVTKLQRKKYEVLNWPKNQFVTNSKMMDLYKIIIRISLMVVNIQALKQNL